MPTGSRNILLPRLLFALREFSKKGVATRNYTLKATPAGGNGEWHHPYSPPSVGGFEGLIKLSPLSQPR